MTAPLTATIVAVVFALVSGITLWLIPHLERIGALDEPNHRSSHAKTTPRGGGAVLALMATIGAGLAGTQAAFSPHVWILLGASLTVSVLGFVDDLRDLTVRMRLGIQVAVGALVVGAVVPGWDLWAAGPPLAVGIPFLVGSANIFNFMDGIDGIAAGTGMASGLIGVLAGALAGDGTLTTIGAIWAAASAGFLTQNWSPARVFLGDAGSLFLGFSLSALVVIYTTVDIALGMAMLAPLLPFFIDGVLTMFARARRGERLTEAHRSHLYQRLSSLRGHAHVALAYIVASFLSGVIVTLAGQAGGRVAAGALGLCVALLGLVYVRIEASLI